jgi:CheY-like chemotaxis protein
MIIVLIIGILVTASFVAGAVLGFPLPENVAFYSLAALTALLTLSVFISRRRKGRLLNEKSEKKDIEAEAEALAAKLTETEEKLAETLQNRRLEEDTAVKFITLVAKLLRVSPADAATLLKRTIRFHSEEPAEFILSAPRVFSTETLITEAFAAAFCDCATANIEITINIAESFPAKFKGHERAIRSALTAIAETAIMLPPRALSIDIDFTTKGDGYDIRFIFEAAGIPLSKAEIEIMIGAVSRGGVGGELRSAKRTAEATHGSFDIKPRGGNTLFTAVFGVEKTAGGVIGSKAAKDIRQLRFLSCDFEFIPYGRVLVCDNNPRRLMAFSDLLMLHGLKTYTAADAEAAAALIRTGENFGVIFLDYDTEQTTKLFRDSGFDGIVIAVSRDELPQNTVTENGFGGQMRKPADPRVVESVLRQFIVSRQPPAVIAAASYSKIKTVKQPPVLPEKTTEPTLEETLAAVEKLGEPPETTQEAAPAVEKAETTKADFILLADEIFIKLYETMDSDLAAFSEHAKAIKIACTDIGNTDLTAKARALEFAAKDGKRAFISEFTPEFLSALKDFSDTLTEKPTQDAFVATAVKELEPAKVIRAAQPPQPAQKAQSSPEVFVNEEQIDAAAAVAAEAVASAPALAGAANAAAVAAEKSDKKLVETIISSCGDFDSVRALEALRLIDTDALNAVAYGLLEEIKSLIAIGELSEAAEMAENLLENLN